MYKNQLFLVLVVAFVYRYFLDLSYMAISDSYPVEFPVKPNTIKIVLSYLVIIPMIKLLCKEDSILSFLFRVIVFFTIIPLSSVYAMKDESSTFFLLTCLSFIVTEFVLFKNGNNYERESNCLQRRNNKKLKIVRIFCFLILFLTIVLMYLQLGVPSLMALVLDDVYDLRQSFQISTYTSYILYVATQVCIPFGIADGYVRKSKTQIIVVILFQLVFFLWTGHKTWFFSIFLMLGIIFLLSIRKSLNYLFVALTLLCAIGYYGNDNMIIGNSVTSLINRRVLLDPAALKYNYYDYFVVKGHSPNLVAGTVLAPLLKGAASAAEDDYSYTISDIYTDKSSNAGTGLYGGDVASVGFLVFIIVPFALFFLAFLTKRTEEFVGKNFTLLMLIYIFFSFNDQRIIQYLLDIRGVFLVVTLYYLSSQQLKKRPYKIEKIDGINRTNNLDNAKD